MSVFILRIVHHIYRAEQQGDFRIIKNAKRKPTTVVTNVTKVTATSTTTEIVRYREIDDDHLSQAGRSFADPRTIVITHYYCYNIILLHTISNFYGTC